MTIEKIENTYPEEEYDVAAMVIDASNNNFSPETADLYRYEEILKASIMNGQITQAKRQAKEFGFNYEITYWEVKGRYPYE